MFDFSSRELMQEGLLSVSVDLFDCDRSSFNGKIDSTLIEVNFEINDSKKYRRSMYFTL